MGMLERFQGVEKANTPARTTEGVKQAGWLDTNTRKVRERLVQTPKGSKLKDEWNHTVVF